MMLLIAFCGEVWETRSVFQGAVGKSQTFPWPRHLSAADGSEREFTPPAVSKSLTRSAQGAGSKTGTRATPSMNSSAEGVALSGP